MELDPDTCYKAVASHDRRFDGRFFVGVSSTGVYCRPICAVRTPKRENCTFYETAAAGNWRRGMGWRTSPAGWRRPPPH